MEIIEHQAQSITVQMHETFDEFADRIHRKSQRPFQYKDGTLVELKPGTAYACLLLEMERLTTAEEFFVMSKRIETALAEVGEEEVNLKGLVKRVGTPFDVPALEALPVTIIAALEERVKVKAHLVGNLGVAMVKEYPSPPPEEFEIEELDAPEEDESFEED